MEGMLVFILFGTALFCLLFVLTDVFTFFIHHTVKTILILVLFITENIFDFLTQIEKMSKLFFSKFVAKIDDFLS